MVISNHINIQYEEIYVKHLDMEWKSTFIVLKESKIKALTIIQVIVNFK